MAWTSPTTWSAGQTVTAADMNAQLRDNLFAIAGSAGFTATPSTGRGIEPLSGYFAGANRAHTHIEGGSITLATGDTGSAFSFGNAYEAAPYLIITTVTTNAAGSFSQNVAIITAISSSGFSAAAWTPTSARWIAFGVDT